MKKIKVLVIAGVLVTIIWGGLFSKTASSQQVESRINNLEADFNRVESRLNQVESQLGQNRQSPSPRTTLTPRHLSQQDRMFDRLATLVIELKQQVKKLEERVFKIESR